MKNMRKKKYFCAIFHGVLPPLVIQFPYHINIISFHKSVKKREKLFSNTSLLRIHILFRLFSFFAPRLFYFSFLFIPMEGKKRISANTKEKLRKNLSSRYLRVRWHKRILYLSGEPANALFLPLHIWRTTFKRKKTRTMYTYNNSVIFFYHKKMLCILFSFETLLYRCVNT